MLNRRYCIIGPTPPPIGGVSVYIERYLHLLKSKSIRYDHYHFGKMTAFQKVDAIASIMFNPKPTTFIINSGNHRLLFLFVLRVLKSKIIYYDHNFRYLEKLKKYEILMLQLFFNKVDRFWAINEQVIEYYKKHGIKLKCLVRIKSCYLPPLDSKSDLLQEDLELAKFVDVHLPLIIANASSIVIYHGIDLYGIDLLFKLVWRLKQKYNNIGLILSIGEVGVQKDYYEALIAEMQNLDINKNIYILLGSNNFWQLSKYATLLIRPTFTDGDSVSIREALYFNCPVLASDCCVRPNKVKLFTNRDEMSLYTSAVQLIEQQNKVHV